MAAVGKVEPSNVSVESRVATSFKLGLERLRRQVQEEYAPAFAEVGDILAAEGLYRRDVADIDAPFRVNRFLNWLRLTHVPGDAWMKVPERAPAARRDEVNRRGREWSAATGGKVFEGYAEGIKGVLGPFARPGDLATSTKEEVTEGLLGLHAFTDQLRFTSGGRDALPARFWSANDDDVERVKATLTHLLHGPGDFVTRLHEVTSDGDWLSSESFAGWSCSERYDLRSALPSTVGPPRRFGSWVFR